MKNKLLIALTILSCFRPAQAQTVDQLVEEGLAGNSLLKAWSLKIQAAESKIASSRAWPAPTLGIEFSQIPIDRYNPWNDALMNALSLSQMIPLANKPGHMAAVETENLHGAQSSRRITRLDIAAQIKMAYYRLWLFDRRIALSEENLQLVRLLQETINAAYTVQQGHMADYLLIASNVALEETNYASLQRLRQAQLYELNALLGRDDLQKDVQPTTALPIAVDSLSADSLESAYLASSPELRQMENMIAMKRAMATVAGKELVPDLMLSASLMRMPRGMILTTKSDPMSMGQGRNIMYGFMASVSLPFLPWSSGRFHAQIQEMNSETAALELEKADMERRMRAQIRAMALKMRTAQQEKLLYESRMLPLNEAAIKAQMTSFQTNQAPLSSVIEALKMLIMQRMSYYMSIADYWMARTDLEKMIGARINR